MWRPSVQFSPFAFSCPLLHVPLSTRLAFILGALAGQATRAYVFLLGSLFSLVVIRPSCEAVLVLQLPFFCRFA